MYEKQKKRNIRKNVIFALAGTTKSAKFHFLFIIKIIKKLKP